MPDTSKRKNDLLLAFGLNAVFLFVLLLFFKPYFETNDDFVMRMLVDGSMGDSSAHLQFINIIFGLLLWLQYRLLPVLPWYTLLQYSLIFCSFTAVSWVLLKRWQKYPALFLSAALLIIFASDAYIMIQFTKTAAVAAAGGALLIGHAVSSSYDSGERSFALPLGIVLALCGSMFRFSSFFPIFALASVCVLDILLTSLKAIRTAGFNAVLSFCRPYIILLLLVLSFYGIDRLAYSGSEWRAYRDYSAARVEVLDYFLPSYEEYHEQYEKAGIPESMVKLMESCNHYDSELITTEKLREISSFEYDGESESKFPGFSEFVFNSLPETLRGWCFSGLLLVALLWFLIGRHDVASLSAFILGGLALLSMLLLLFIKGRYNMYRVEYGLVMALSLGLSAFIPSGRSFRHFRAELLILVFAAVLISAYLRVGSGMWQRKFTFGSNDFTASYEQYDFLSRNDNVYIADIQFLYSYYCDGPFAPVRQNLWNHIVFTGGWHAMHPVVISQMDSLGISNPFRALCSKSEISLISGTPDLYLDYLREQYSFEADAVMIYKDERIPSSEIFLIQSTG